MVMCAFVSCTPYHQLQLTLSGFLLTSGILQKEMPLFALTTPYGEQGTELYVAAISRVDLDVTAQVSKLDGRSIYTSKQLIMIATDLPNAKWHGFA